MFVRWINQADAWLSKRVSLVYPKVPPISYQEDLSWTGPATRLVATTLITIFILWSGYFLFIHIGPASSLSDPRLREVIPTAVATPTFRVITDPLAGHQWLTQEQARALRTQSNVVNLAMVNRGGASYSATSSVIFSGKAPWDHAKSFSVDSLSVNGTTTEINLKGQTYDLNVYQPFVNEQDKKFIFLVDGKGQLWQSNLSDVNLIPLDQVQLPIQVAPNSNLSFTLGER